VAFPFRDAAAAPLRKAIVESGERAPFETRIPFFFGEFATTVAFCYQHPCQVPQFLGEAKIVAAFVLKR
jgi:hypothetical protein